MENLDNKRVTVEAVQKNEEVKALMQIAERQLEIMGYTEHSLRHAGITAKRVTEILTKMCCPQREVELGQIAGYLHDIGNSVNRENHPQSGAVLCYKILTDMGMPVDEASEILAAVGNHDEKAGKAISRISAALIIADKSDVHRTRVRKDRIKDKMLMDMTDIHDRVNYAVKDNELIVDTQAKEILFRLDIDTEICSAMDYFEIFLERMRLCKNAAQFLGFQFKMSVNNYRLV